MVMRRESCSLAICASANDYRKTLHSHDVADVDLRQSPADRASRAQSCHMRHRQCHSPVCVGLFWAEKITTYGSGDKVKRRARLSHALTDEL